MSRNKRTFDTPKVLIHLVAHCANPSCGCEFWPNTGKGQKGKYCSDKCKQEAYRTRKTLAKGKLLLDSLKAEYRNTASGQQWEQLDFEEELAKILTDNPCPLCGAPLEQDIDNDLVCPSCLYVKRGDV